MHIASVLQAPKRETSSYARGATISIHVLGPQVILRDGEEIHPPAPQQRRVLAVLASHPGEVVAREAISQRIWGSATAQQLRSLQSYISHLRTILGTHARKLGIDPDALVTVRYDPAEPDDLVFAPPRAVPAAGRGAARIMAVAQRSGAGAADCLVW